MAKQSAYYGDKHIGYIVSSGKSYRKVYYNNNSYLLKTLTGTSTQQQNYSQYSRSAYSSYGNSQTTYSKTWKRVTNSLRNVSWSGSATTMTRSKVGIGFNSIAAGQARSSASRVGMSMTGGEALQATSYNIQNSYYYTLTSTAQTNSTATNNFVCTGSSTTLSSSKSASNSTRYSAYRSSDSFTSTGAYNTTANTNSTLALFSRYNSQTKSSQIDKTYTY